MDRKHKKDEILYDHNQDGIERRGFLKCMAWAGTGLFLLVEGGVLAEPLLRSHDSSPFQRWSALE